jgi:hypothetical protein
MEEIVMSGQSNPSKKSLVDSSNQRRHRRLERAVRSILEPLEQRMYLSISWQGNTLYSAKGVPIDPGDIDGSGSLTVFANQALGVDRVRGNSLTLVSNATLTIKAGNGPQDYSHVSVINSLTLGAGATLDLMNNVLIVEPTLANRQQTYNGNNGILASNYNQGLSVVSVNTPPR